MYTLSLLFLTLPLYFSHIFMHFGVVIWDMASFERQKMLFFSILLIIATIEILLTRYQTLTKNLQKYGCLLIGLLGLPLIATWLYDIPIDSYWLRGSYEKFHGYLLYSGILWLGFLITPLTPSERKKLTKLNLIPATLVSLIAISEWCWLTPFLPPRGDVWGEWIRSIATLGNPNYLAGYLLISLPLVPLVRRPLRTIMTMLIILGILSTKSYLGIGLMMLYGIISIGRQLISKWDTSKRQIFWSVWILAVVIWIWIWLSALDASKLLSLESRFVLMGEVLKNLLSHPIGSFTGYGPESVLRFFEASRSIEVGRYFPTGSIIDSSHNILFDMIFQYGIVPLIFLGYFIRKHGKYWNPYARDAWILGVAFLMMNPYVVVHLSLLTLTFLTHDRSQYI